jgi:hypothetical protein
VGKSNKGHRSGKVRLLQRVTTMKEWRTLVKTCKNNERMECVVIRVQQQRKNDALVETQCLLKRITTVIEWSALVRTCKKYERRQGPARERYGF